jgi:hypothetical protein
MNGKTRSGSALALFASLVLFAACKHRGDSAVRENLPGVWHVNFLSAKEGGGESTFVIAPNGDFTHKTISPDGMNIIESFGAFQIKDGVLVETVTKSSYTNWHLPFVRRARIIRAADREMVVMFEDTKDEFTIRKVAR